MSITQNTEVIFLSLQHVDQDPSGSKLTQFEGKWVEGRVGIIAVLNAFCPIATAIIQ